MLQLVSNGCVEAHTVQSSKAHIANSNHVVVGLFAVDVRLQDPVLDVGLGEWKAKFNKEAVKKISASKKIADFSPGDTVRVGVKIIEGKRERVQYFEGVCIAKKNRDINSSFTVRKISFGEGVERTFALYSPNVSSIKIVRSGKVRRAKLYYLRDRKGKSARIAEKIKKKIGIDIAPEPKQVLENVPSEESVNKETPSAEKKTEVSKVKKQTSDKKLEAENKPKK